MTEDPRRREKPLVLEIEFIVQTKSKSKEAPHGVGVEEDKRRRDPSPHD